MSTLHRYADYLPAPIADQFPSPVRNRERIRPLTAGQFFADFYLEEENVINHGPLLKAGTGGTSLHLLTAQPLVVAFYSVNWNGYGDALIAELIAKHAAIEAAGARLLVLSSEGKKHFSQFNRQPLPFDVVRDAQHRIARKAGIYKESDPIWGRVAGVNADVPVPAVYLITPSLEITYSFADVNLEQRFSADELLSVVDKQLAISA